MNYLKSLIIGLVLCGVGFANEAHEVEARTGTYCTAFYRTTTNVTSVACEINCAADKTAYCKSTNSSDPANASCECK